MNPNVISLLEELKIQRYIGGKHIPEAIILKKIQRRMSNKKIREFQKEYKNIHKYLIRVRKRKHKDMDWHISINPKYLKEIEQIIMETTWD